MIRAHASRGQTAVEFALTASLMFFLLFAVIDFGRALYEYNQLAQAARLGARWAMANTPLPTNDCVTSGGTCQTAILSYLENKSGIDSSRLSSSTAITFGPADGTCNSEPVANHTCYVNVHLDYTFKWLVLPLPNHDFTADSQMFLTSQYCDSATPCAAATP